MGLEGMIGDVIRQCDFTLNGHGSYSKPMTLGEVKDISAIARHITNAENGVAEKEGAKGGLGRGWIPTEGGIVPIGF